MTEELPAGIVTVVGVLFSPNPVPVTAGSVIVRSALPVFAIVTESELTVPVVTEPNTIL